MAAAVDTTPTPEELQSAWCAMRSRQSLRHWPATFEEVMSDERRAKCIAIEATAARRRQQRRPCAPVFIGVDLASRPDQSEAWHWRPAKPTSAGSIDLKRAAAGDRKD